MENQFSAHFTHIPSISCIPLYYTLPFARIYGKIEPSIRKGCVTLKKRIFCLMIAFLMLTLPSAMVPFTAEPSQKTILVVEGKQLTLRSFDNHLYVSLNALCRAIDKTSAKFRIEDGIFYADIQKGALSASAVEGEKLVVANERYLYSDYPNVYRDKVLYVPVESAIKAVGGHIQKTSGNYRYLKINEGAAIAHGDNYYDSDCVLWLGRIIQAESGNQPLDGKIAVGTVVMNRVDSPDYPNTIYSVIFDRKYGVQFTPAATGSVWCTPSEESIKAAKIVLEGYRTNDDILFFMNEAIATSTWISDNCEYAFTIADHSFWS